MAIKNPLRISCLTNKKSYTLLSTNEKYFCHFLPTNGNIYSFL